MKKKIEILDTTLRDGEQTSGVSFSSLEKLTIAKMLLNELKVDRIEVASARVSDGEFDAVKKITTWAESVGKLEKIEVLGFVDGGKSLDWMEKSGAKVLNLLTKGSMNHLKHQLKKSPEQHFSEIEEVILDAKKRGFQVNVYLEDWSNGMRNSKDYVHQFIQFLSKQPIKRILLPDTLGILVPWEVKLFVSELTTTYPDIHFDFHAHNDYDLGTANAYEGILAGAKGLHLTINGMGERAGNAPLASTIAVMNDFFQEYQTNIDESKLYAVSLLVESFSGVRIPQNKPVVGEYVFTQTAGVHADGDKKNNLYHSKLMPERFGRKRKYALGKTSGKANIENNLEEFGIKLTDEELKIVTQRIIQLGDRKEMVTKEDLPYIISNVLDRNAIQKNIIVENYVLTHSKDLDPSCTLKVNIEGVSYESSAQGDGQYDAFMKALDKTFQKIGKKMPVLTDYTVRIPPGGNTDALCETKITWKYNNKEYITRGLDSDQTVSAIQATEKMLNLL
ncbi:MAG: hypothetical protein RIR51_1179 [Bacteroidota bacterium]